MINDNAEDKMIRDQYKSHLDARKNNDPALCPPPELVLGYYQKDLTGKLRYEIEDHIIQCPLCLKALEALSKTAEVKLPENWSAIEKMIDDKYYAGIQSVSPKERKENSLSTKINWNSFKELFRSFIAPLIQPKRFVYAGAVAGFTIVCIYSYAYLSRDKYFVLARIEPKQQIQMRAETDHSALSEGLKLYNQKKYDESILQLENFLETNPNHFTACFYLGLSHLSKAELTLLGLAYKYDISETEKGFAKLTRALQLSGDNLYYRADCHWYLGKACLMKGNISEARSQFWAITQLNQPHLTRILEAQEMIKKLNEGL